MKREYGVVLIGCGHIGEEYMRDIYFREGIRIVGVVDTDRSRAGLFARKYGAESCGTEYLPYLDRGDVDIVIIATYVSTHGSILRECLKRGKHVVCEKPIGRSLAEGRAFVDLVKHSPCKVLVSYVLRYNETYRTAARLIQSGAIGSVKMMRMVQNHHAKDWPRYRNLLKDCPPIVDCGVHYMDVMQWFTGSKVTAVDGFGAVIDDDLPEGEYNYGVIHVRLENGAAGYYESGWSKTLASSNVKEFVGDRGRLSITLGGFRSKDAEEGDLIELYTYEGNRYEAFNVRAKYKDMWAELRQLIRMIETGAPAVPTIGEVYSTFETVLRADAAVRARLFGRG